MCVVPRILPTNAVADARVMSMTSMRRPERTGTELLWTLLLMSEAAFIRTTATIQNKTKHSRASDFLGFAALKYLKAEVPFFSVRNSNWHVSNKTVESCGKSTSWRNGSLFTLKVYSLPVRFITMLFHNFSPLKAFYFLWDILFTVLHILLVIVVGRICLHIKM